MMERQLSKAMTQPHIDFYRYVEEYHECKDLTDLFWESISPLWLRDSAVGLVV